MVKKKYKKTGVLLIAIAYLVLQTNQKKKKKRIKVYENINIFKFHI